MPQLSDQDLAASYGFAYSFLQSDKTLKKLFHDAVSGSWTAEKFTAELRNTGWYKNHGESARQWAFLQNTDPGTAKQRKAQMIAQMRDAADQLGAAVTPHLLDKLATNALIFNWNESQIRDQLAGYVKAVNGQYGGAAGSAVDEIRQAAWRNGIRVSGQTLQSWAQAVASGHQDVDFFKQHLRDQAATLAPGYEEKLKAGMDLYDIASPYIQSKAKILEMNPADIDLFDNDVRGALSGKGADGRPATKSLWQFEQDVRSNPLWLKTKGAQDAVTGTAKRVLADFGFQG